MNPRRRRTSPDVIAPFGRRGGRGGGHGAEEPTLLEYSGGGDPRWRKGAVEVDERAAELAAPDGVPSVGQGTGGDGWVPRGRAPEAEKAGDAASGAGYSARRRHRAQPSSCDRSIDTVGAAKQEEGDSGFGAGGEPNKGECASRARRDRKKRKNGAMQHRSSISDKFICGHVLQSQYIR